MEKTTFDTIINAIDNRNALDPIIETIGENVPKELLYSIRMSDVLASIDKEASYELQIACRAQHIERWKYPRSDYPEGRAGYLQWRTMLYAKHAEITAEIAAECDADSESVEKIRTIMENKVKGDGDSQTLEDVACLVFIKHYFGEFMLKHSEEKLLKIVQKTWGKMSEAAKEKAMTYVLPQEQKELLEKALS